MEDNSRVALHDNVVHLSVWVYVFESVREIKGAPKGDAEFHQARLKILMSVAENVSQREICLVHDLL